MSHQEGFWIPNIGHVKIVFNYTSSIYLSQATLSQNRKQPVIHFSLNWKNQAFDVCNFSIISMCINYSKYHLISKFIKERNNIQHIFMFLSQAVALNLLFLCQAIFHVSLFAYWSSCLPFIAVFVVICVGIIHCILKLAMFSQQSLWILGDFL